MVVQGVLALVPHIKRLVHHQHADLVAGLEKRQGGRIVGDAQGVEARLLETGDLAPLRVGEGGGAQSAVVVVDTAAP